MHILDRWTIVPFARAGQRSVPFRRGKERQDGFRGTAYTVTKVHSAIQGFIVVFDSTTAMNTSRNQFFDTLHISSVNRAVGIGRESGLSDRTRYGIVFFGHDHGIYLCYISCCQVASDDVYDRSQAPGAECRMRSIVCSLSLL